MFHVRLFHLDHLAARNLQAKPFVKIQYRKRSNLIFVSYLSKLNESKCCTNMNNNPDSNA